MTAVMSCSSDGSKDKDAKASPTPVVSQSSKPADPTEAAKKDAIAVYQAYWQEMEKLYADPTGEAANLKQYAASAALLSAEEDAKSTHNRDVIHLGDVSVGNPTVTKLDINRKVPNATLSSCLDISRWQVVDAHTKKSVSLPANRLTKYVMVSTVERWPEGWRVIRDEPQDRRC